MNSLTQDAWLGDILGQPVYHLTGSPTAFAPHGLPPAPAFIGAKVSVGDSDGLLHLQRHGFRVVDTNIQLFRHAAPMPPATRAVRLATASDESAVRALAYASFEHNRFHRDPEISNDAASHIKEEWAANYFAGQRGDWMILAEDGGQVAGFLQLLRKDDKTLVIDLIAVGEPHRGKGLAKAMISHAANTCLNAPASIQVGTQIANIPSLALYTALGFGIISAAYVLHLHIRDEPV